MIRIKLYLAGMLCITAGQFSYAQSDVPISNRLSLSSALQLGLKNNPGLEQQQAHIQAAAYSKRLVNRKFMPDLQVQAQNSYGTYGSAPGAFFPLPGNINFSGPAPLAGQPKAATNLQGSMLLDWKVLEFGRRRLENSVADYQENTAKQRYEAAQLSLKTRISTLYLEILNNQSTLNWAKANTNRMAQMLQLAESLAEAGLKPAADTLFILSAYQQALAEQNNWQGKANSSQILLGEVLAIPTATFEYPVDNFMGNIKNGMDFPSKTQADTITDHPYLHALNMEVNVKKSEKELAQRQLFPSVSFMAGLATRGSSLSASGNTVGWQDSYDNRQNNYLAGMAITWNLNSAYNTPLETKLADQKMKMAKARSEEQSLKMNTQLQALNARILEQEKQITNANNAVNNARKAYESYVSRYQNGLISMTELLQIQLLLHQSEKNQLEVYQQFWLQTIHQAELTGDFSYLTTQF